ncbi:hypothetical protein Cob_v011642 [Colletotrichum orbiculare MAFF 240422]|uniref:Uncharacterized protein n=1 Tax=Colletotrichum orbiculare (strain 104-T / ATCC 96160 / CBS 514.97 / LARS 414 / MAFF 240422) TaxID=1213857 RepID=A0A484FD84_COLOR|nr:hypothetical protein Cob_v011642 [Colletotrichum orbiculare MAFF 240422]
MTQCKACSDTVQARSRHYKCTAIRARSFGGTLRCVEDEMTERYYHCNCGLLEPETGFPVELADGCICRSQEHG